MRNLIISLTLFLTYVPGFGQARNIAAHRNVNHLGQIEQRTEQRNQQRLNRAERPASERPLDRVKRIQALKAAFIIRQLDLTPQQYEKFGPVYNNYQNELFDLQKQKRLNLQQPSSLDQIEKQHSIEQKIVDLKDHYVHEFLNILPPEKVGLIEKSEMQFNQEVLKELSEQRKNQVGN